MCHNFRSTRLDSFEHSFINIANHLLFHRLPNGHINFEKFWQLAKQVNEFIGWKQVTCPYEKNNKIIMFLQTNSILNENTLAMASFDCEPPENSSEKDRYKTLKHEHFNN